jgi:ribosomal protein S18 acetylase RimI-like enzyme
MRKAAVRANTEIGPSDPRMRAARFEVGTQAGKGLICDSWLSSQLGVAAFSISESADVNVEPGERPAFLQAKVDIGDRLRTEALIRAGYMLVETAVMLAKDIARVRCDNAQLRFAEPSDAPGVCPIAGCAFRQSRFHMDPLIGREAADRIKARWAGNYFSGQRGTHMVVALDGSTTAGFLLLIARGEELVIDLVGVLPSHQGRGIGRAMLDFAAARVEGPRRFIVGTQLCNVRSLAYYTGRGFQIVGARHSLHRHLSRRGAATPSDQAAAP